MSDQPFAGITVIEFGQFIAVPYCATLLADGGATVIKVEPLEGEPTRHLAPLLPGETRHFLSRNRGKRSLPLQLSHPETGRILDALLAEADVVLTNLRPGLAAQLGLDFAQLSARYPRLVVGNVTAFGEKGPDSSLAGMDLVVQARSGLLASNGRQRDGLPVAPDSPIADYMCAALLAFGVATALYRRSETGRGSEVDVTLLQAALALQNNLMIRVESVDGPTHTATKEWLAEARASGVPYVEQAAHVPGIRTAGMTSIYYRTFATKDEAIAVACVSPGLQRRLMEAVGLQDAALGNAITDRAELARHYAALQATMEATMASRTTAEWRAVFDAAGIPASEVRFPLEMLDDEQVAANGFVHDLPHPRLGPVRVLSSPLRIDKAGFTPGAPVAPFGSDTRGILAGAGFTEAEVERFIESGATLALDDSG